MITLKNIKKTYQTKNGVKVEALNDINLVLPTKGLIFLIGPSGSGKTTLMNIIGGLDFQDGGIFTFLNKEFHGSNMQELDDYRRDYVGFIFQDFNLIHELNVEENLAIACTFSQSNGHLKINETLSKVGLEGYEKRYPSELSGGQLQRIAIARAILKDSKVLLADEPTGNLDKKTGHEILKALKEISKEKLVVIVSHNEELAKSYADDIVQIEDGRILSEQKIKEENSHDTYQIKDGQNFSNKIAFKMALHNLGLKKIRLLITILLMLISYGVISFTISIFQYHHAEPSYNLIKTRNYEYFKLIDIDYYSYQKLKNGSILTAMDSTLSLFIESKEEAMEMGIEFYSDDIELTKDNYYVSDSALRFEFYSGSEAIIDGKKVKLNYENFKFTDVIGNYLSIDGYKKKVAGIYKSPFEFPIYEPNHDKVSDNYLVDFYGSIIAKTETYRGQKSNKENIVLTSYAKGNNKTLDSQVYLNMLEDVIVIEKDIVYDFNYQDIDESLDDHEIYLDLATYNKIFGTNYYPSYFFNFDSEEDPVTGESSNVYQVTATPEYLDEIITIQVNNITHDRYETFENFVVKGIVFEKYDIDNNSINHNTTFYLNSKLATKMNLCVNTFSLWVRTDSVRGLQRFLHTCVDDYNADVITPISNELLAFENSLSTLQLAMILVCVSLVVIVVLMTIVLISQSIYLRKKEIGVLKSMGARNKDIRKIYLLEISILIIPIYILSIYSSYFIITGINAGFVSSYSSDYQFIYFKFSNIPYLLLAIFVINFIATIIPLNRIGRMKTIEAIRK